MALETIGLKAVLEGASGYLSNLDKIDKAERKVGDGAEDAAKRTQNMGSMLTKMSLVGTTAFVGLGALAVKFAMGFENQMSQVGAVLQANDADMKKLSATAKQLGADTAFSAGDAAKAMEELAAGGRSVAQIIGGEAKAAVDLAAAGNYDLAQSARTIATTMDIWKDSTIDTADVVNRLAGAANTSRFGVEDMSAAIAQGGGVAAQAGVSFQDFSTVIAATASSFASGSDAGTSFKTFVVSLTGSSEKAKDMIKELGLEFYNAQGQLKPMSEIVQQLNEKLSGLSQEQQTVALKTIFGNDAFRTAAGLMKLTGEEFSAMSNKMRDTDASAVAEQRMDNLAGSLEQLKGSMETLAIATGERVIPMLNTLAQGATVLTNGFAAMPASTQNMVLGFTAIVVALPAMISGIEKAGKFIANLDTVMASGKGRAAAFAAGLGLIAIGVDVLLQKTTGAGLVDRIFGDVGRSEAAKEALRQWNVELVAAGPNADRLSVSTSAFNDLIAKAGGSTAKLTEEASGLNDVLLGSDARFFGFNVGASDAIDKTKALQEETKLLAAQMVASGASGIDLKNVYDQLPPALQKAFDSVVNVNEAYGKSEENVEKARFAILEANKAHEETAEVVPTVTTALDAFEAGIAAMEAETGKAVDVAKEFNEALDTLAGRFSTFNPAVTVAQGKLAAVDEELADLKRSGGEWSESLGMTKKQLEDEKKALEDVIEAAGENESATKGMRDELKLYIGEGLINVQSEIRDTIKSHEDQITAEQNVAKALRALSNDDIPGFVAALETVNEKSPEVAKAVVANLGPDLSTKLRANIPELKATGSALGGAIATGLEEGLNSGANRISAAGRGLVRGTIEAMEQEAQVQSPSKVTEALGIFMAEGLALGIQNGLPMVVASAEQMVKEGVATAKAVLDKALADGELTPQLGADGKWGLPGSPGFTPASGTNNVANGSSYILGSDGNWYTSEAAMPKGVTGFSSPGIQEPEVAGGRYYRPDFVPGDYAPGYGTGYRQFYGDFANMGGQGNANISAGLINPATDVVKGSSSSPSGGGGGTVVTVDLRNSSFGDQQSGAEEMIKRVITSALKDVSGRDAFLQGVKV